MEIDKASKISISDKIVDCSKLLHTGDLNDWEEQFISTLSDNLTRYGSSIFISDKQDYYLNKIWTEHFGQDTE